MGPQPSRPGIGQLRCATTVVDGAAIGPRPARQRTAARTARMASPTVACDGTAAGQAADRNGYGISAWRLENQRWGRGRAGHGRRVRHRDDGTGLVPAMGPRPGRPRTASSARSALRGQSPCHGAVAGQAADRSACSGSGGGPGRCDGAVGRAARGQVGHGRRRGDRLGPAMGPRPIRPRTDRVPAPWRSAMTTCDGAAAGQAADRSLRSRGILDPVALRWGRGQADRGQGA